MDTVIHSGGVVLALLLGGSVAEVAESDRDGDGIRDALEQALIERFRPRFLVSTRECAGLPAEFQPFSVEPRATDRNGTLYARVSPSTASAGGRAALEIHYYHLWDRDCGPISPHALDVERVSAWVTTSSLETGTGADGFRARYWYAAAHENTVCDTSNAARAEALGAITGGPNVWISAGKHASYLSVDLCRQRGCGVDDCTEMVPLVGGRLINIGENGAPLDGAVWIASPEWPLADKLDAVFDEDLIARLDAHDETVVARVHGQWRSTHFSLSIGGDAVGALGHAGRHGGGSLVEAEQHTRGALGTTFRAVGRALGLGAEDDASGPHRDRKED